MITDREKFLMIHWGKVIQHYKESLCDDIGKIEEWLNTVIDDAGHTVEQELSCDADQYESSRAVEKRQIKQQ